MQTPIRHQLNRIESEHRVTILLACESGSRAWGFPSRDSDYDVRFIYVHPQEWYLSIADNRDVIECPVDDLLDINGWDLNKALQLMRKSNSPLQEWISSPIRYFVDDHALETLTTLSRKAFMPESACHHYLAMARGSLAKIAENPTVRLKTYMYAIRPVLCCEWITRHLTHPPMQIEHLIADSLSTPEALKQTIREWIEIKKDQTEAFLIPRSAEIDAFLIHQVAALEDHIPKNPGKMEIAEFDHVFRTMVIRYAQGCSRQSQRYDVVCQRCDCGKK